MVVIAAAAAQDRTQHHTTVAFHTDKNTRDVDAA